MQVLFESFTDNTEIKTTTVKFDFFELRHIYKTTQKDNFILFMKYMTVQIVKYKLTLNLDNFDMTYYSATDEGLFYNSNVVDKLEDQEYNQKHITILWINGIKPLKDKKTI